MPDLNKIQDQVEQIMKDYYEARNDDKFLIAYFMIKLQDIKTFSEYYHNKDIPTVESIRRVRQKIQSSGKYLPTLEKVRKARRISEEVYRKYALEKG